MPKPRVHRSAITGRDLAIVQLVVRFGQLSSQHIHQLLFTSSYTPSNRALRRLTDEGFLHRIERRIVGGSQGGSGQYVYSLGRRGYYLHFTGRYEPSRAIRFHSLAIADTYVKLRSLERAGRLSIAGYSTEPDCWVLPLKPDMYVDLVRPSGSLKAFFEVDMGSEGQGRIRAKLETYYRAYSEWEGPVFPLVIFVAIDREREKELKWVISQIGREAQTLFQVCTLDTLEELVC